MSTEKTQPLPRGLMASLFHPWTWRMAWRDSRSQRARLLIFSLAIVSGIAALVAIHSLKASMQQAIETQAKALLGSDLQVSSRQTITAEVEAKLASKARSVSRETSFSSMLAFPTTNGARLVQVRGIEGGYPFYGKVDTAPPDAWQQMQAGEGVLVEATLLEQFQAKVGDPVKLGTKELPILGVVTKGAPRSSRFAGFAPEVYVRLSTLADTGLLGKSSLASYALHLELPDGVDANQLKTQVQTDFPNESWRLETPDNRRENLGDALENLQQFLGLIALASLALGAIGVAGAVHAHVVRRIPTVAILRCLGCPANLAFGIYFVQAVVLGVIGAVLGAVIGLALHVGVLGIFKDSLPIVIDTTPSWKVLIQTTAAGFTVCCGFALLPLLKVRQISPAATLRGGVALQQRGWLRVWPVYLVLAGVLVTLALLNDPNWKRALALVMGLAIAFGTLLMVARGLIYFTRKLVGAKWPYLLRQGISNLHRPQNQTLLFLLSLGLGTFLLVTILLSGHLLNQRLNLTHSQESPNLYLIDVQPDQVDGVKTLLQNQQLPLLESAPMVTMRIESVRGVPVRDYSTQNNVPKWIARREFRSTYRDYLNHTEKVIAGEWHASVADPHGLIPVSLEEGLAKDLRVAVGDEMTIDVQGIPLKTRISSIRKVDWSRFNLNFFMIFPPGVLEDAPGFHVVTTRTSSSAASGELQRALVQKFPNVSAIDLTQILETVRSILEKVSMVITVLGGFTVLAGLPILVGTLLNGRDVRTRESVLLRTLGASAKQVRTILVIEYAALGILSAVTGLVLAVAANAGLAHFVFKASMWPDATVLLVAFATTTAVSVVGGLLLSRGVCHHPPLEILRSGA